jgi:glutaconate CoA-transferase, subunit A
MAKFQSLSDAIADNLCDGDTVAFEGFSHLIPHAAAHEAIRQGKSDLTLIRMTPDIIYDQLIGVGLARKLVFSYIGNPGVGRLHRILDSMSNDWPRRIETVEHSHSAMANAYEAGAAGLPFAVFRGYLGNDLPSVNPSIAKIACPFTGEELAAVPAVQLDVAIIHAQRASERGDVLIEGITGVQKEAALAAKRVVVTVEEVVPDFNKLHTNACVLPHWMVDSVTVVQGGAHPSYAFGYYSRDNEYYRAWDAISADRECFRAWVDENILQASPDVFAERVRGLRLNG